MVMSTVDVPVTTIEDLFALPEDGVRHELLQGTHVVTPAPRYTHQHVAGEFFNRLRSHLNSISALEALFSPADIQLGPDTLVQPDIFVLKVNPTAPPESWADIGVPVLVVEVLSPGTASRDRGAKRKIYQEAGVSEYWIVDSDSRMVERWRPEDERPAILRETLDWQPEAGELLKINLVELFESLNLR
jgi:Uma2 family endonuclease